MKVAAIRTKAYDMGRGFLMQVLSENGYIWKWEIDFSYNIPYFNNITDFKTYLKDQLNIIREETGVNWDKVVIQSNKFVSPYIQETYKALKNW